jgi:hypothetical protein
MKKNKLTVLLCLLLVSMLFAADKYEAMDKYTARTARRVDGAPVQAPLSPKVHRAQYVPAARQGAVLFVEDPAALGPPSPDQYWTAVLDSILGTGNYGWYAVDTFQTTNGPDLATMQSYELVIWNTYDCWNSALGPAITATDQTNIANYISGGGKVWLIGQDILYTGVPISWMTANFELQSAIEDYNGAAGTTPYPVVGVAELSGLGFSFLVDWGSDVFADALTPTASAHHIIQDVAFPSYYPSIVSNDYTTSFWTVDGRNPNPWADWQDMVYIMLEAFGVLGPEAFWDFETGLQGWTHTNGQAFPAGWDVEPSSYKPTWTPPDAGDSTMWIDSDAAGSGVLVEDTTWSPAVVPPANMAWLKYGLGYNNLTSTSDSLYVGVMTFTSGAWNPPVQLKRYSADYGPAWDSLDVTAYNTADSIRIYFYYSGMYDWWAGFDNVGLYAPPGEDVGVTAILEPVGVYSLNDVVTPQAEVRNFGDLDETFPVIFTMTRNAVLVYADTVDITLAAGVADTAIFDSYTFTQAGAYDIVSYTELIGDENPANDTAYATASIFEWVEDFESSNGGYVAYPVTGAWEWGVPTSGPGAAHSGTQLWATVLAGNYTINANWKLTTQDDYVAAQDNPVVSFYHWYDTELRYDGGNVKYSTDDTTWLLLHPFGGYDDTAYTANVGIPAESCFTGHDQQVWEAEEFIIPVTSGQTFKLRFHFGSDGSVQYPGWYIDDLAGIGFNYVGIEEEPGSGHVAVFGFAPSMSTVHRNHVPIAYNTTAPSHVSLKVYDNMGRLVRTLVDAQQPAGEKSVLWDNKDLNKRAVANGVYFLKLEAEGQTAVQKLILVK